MEHYRLEDLKVGLEKEFSVSVTEEKMQMFQQISGDVNPLHTDAAFARAKGYPGRVAYGMLTSSFYSALAGVYLPGERCLLYEVDVKFVKPVFIGDVLTVWGRVEEVNETHSFIRVKARVKNAKGEIVPKAKIMTGVLEDGT